MRFRLEDALQQAEPDVRKVILELADLAPRIYHEIPDHFGFSEGVNIYGEQQAEVDVWTNDLLVKRLEYSGEVREIATEELKAPINTGEGSLSVVVDPMDGTKNLDANNMVGTIVGIYREKPLPAKGRDLEAALYFLYGPYLGLTLALDGEVHRFVYGMKSGGFFGSSEPSQIPSKAEVYGMGGDPLKWIPAVHRLVDEMKKRGMKQRYGGSLVGDFNQVLTYGGIFGYPAMIDAPKGKLRLQFECNPMAFITENAQGKSTDGSKSVLDVEPVALDQRAPVYIGNSWLVERLEELTKA